jgi:hypothetical protein
MKFSVTEIVYYNSERGIVTQHHMSGSISTYEVLLDNGACIFAYESQLINVGEYLAQQKANSNNASVPISNMSFEEIEALYMGTSRDLPEPKCVCGAEAVKSPKHSSWCEIEGD